MSLFIYLSLTSSACTFTGSQLYESLKPREDLDLPLRPERCDSVQEWSALLSPTGVRQFLSVHSPAELYFVLSSIFHPQSEKRCECLVRIAPR